MPVEMFLKLAGIEGKSTDAKHKGEIDPDGSLGAQETFKWDVTAVKPV